MDLAEMLRKQYAQQEAMWGTLPADRLAQRQLAQQFISGLTVEQGQYLRAIAYGTWMPKEESRPNRILEIADMLKYLLCVAWTEDVTAVELETAFEDRTLSTQRKRVLSDTPDWRDVVAFDIDGVLCSKCDWEDEEAFAREHKVLWLAPHGGTISLLKKLKRAGYGIVIITSRKAWLYKSLEADTIRWLDLNGIPYDALLWGYDKLTTIKQRGENVIAAFEDSPKHALDLAQGGIPVVYLGIEPVSHPLIRMPLTYDEWDLEQAMAEVLA